MRIKLHSNVGRRRSSNQDYADYYQNSHNQVLLVLCDGVGGHQAGDVASLMTTKFLGERFVNQPERFTLETIQTWLLDQINEVNQYIYNTSVSEQNLEGMGTTLVLATFVDEYLVVAHVGDSRAYIYHQEELTQITEDHSLVNELIRMGEITKEEGATHPQRNAVTQSIGGTMEVSPELKIIPLTDVEVLMLCSDGLTNMVPFAQLQDMFIHEAQLVDFPERLINAANEAGGADNITVILAHDLSEAEVAK